MLLSALADLDTETRLYERQLDAVKCGLNDLNMLHTVQSGAEVLLDGGDCMGTPGGFHPSHHQPLFPIPLVYLVLCFFLYIISS